jgi:hypothetical protein
MSKSKPKPSRRRSTPPPASRAFYLAQAQACMAAATASTDPSARRLHEEECKLWLILARQRQAIEAVLQRYLDAPEVEAHGI